MLKRRIRLRERSPDVFRRAMRELSSAPSEATSDED
jgi:hypothetical protein